MEGGDHARFLVVSVTNVSIHSPVYLLIVCPASIKNHGAEHEVNDMFDVGAETLDLPLSEKMKYEQGDNGDSFGYVKAVSFRL